MCDGRLCPECSAEIALRVVCQEERRDITPNDFAVMDTRLRIRKLPWDTSGALITVLGAGQTLDLKMKVAKGTGREHAKWIPCVPTKWSYDEPPDDPDGSTTTYLTLELKGVLDGKSILKAACKVLREKLAVISRQL